MERVARVFAQNKHSREIVDDDEFVRALWPAIVGKTIARHTGRVRLVRSTLIVEVEDTIWQRQLHSLSRQIVDRLQKGMGTTAIQDVEFRIGVPRMRPQRELSLSGSPQRATDLTDEAERIQDPVLKKVYRLSRKKATA